MSQPIAPKPKRLIHKLPIAFVDTETTGMNPGIQEILTITIGKIGQPNKTWKVRCVRPHLAQDDALRINQIDLKDHLSTSVPDFRQVYPEILAELKSCQWLGWNPRFDLDMLLGEARVWDLDISQLRYTRLLNGMDMAYLAMPHLELTSLACDAVCRQAGIVEHDAHTSSGDVDRLRELWTRYFQPLMQAAPQLVQNTKES